YLTAPLVLLGWAACLLLFFSGQSFLPALATFFLASTCYNAVGNFASFFEIGNSVILDGAHHRVLLLPLNIANFLFSTLTVSLALAKYYGGRILGLQPPWHKTERYRNGNGNNHAGGNGNGGSTGNGDPNGRGLNFIRARSIIPGSPAS
ncbi:MAG: hypothetical protein O7E51_05435, partial [Acidobacteria bacterium]|nr:hypothetical protein [Acidobacteriota bacterium]